MQDASTVPSAVQDGAQPMVVGEGMAGSESSEPGFVQANALASMSVCFAVRSFPHLNLTALASHSSRSGGAQPSPLIQPEHLHQAIFQDPELKQLIAGEDGEVETILAAYGEEEKKKDDVVHGLDDALAGLSLSTVGSGVLLAEKSASSPLRPEETAAQGEGEVEMTTKEPRSERDGYATC
ncbi:hypothetical protein JCM6882_003561 [Rhodosporidiobolus microsporus]